MNLLDISKRDVLADNVFEVNLMYLLTAQKLLLHDFELGLVRTGMDRDQAQALLDLKTIELTDIARSTNLIVSLKDCNFFSIFKKTKKFTAPAKQAFLDISAYADQLSKGAVAL